MSVGFSQRSRMVAGSCVLHLLLLLTLATRRHARELPIQRPGTAHGSRITLTYSPGSSVAQPRNAPVHAASEQARVLAAHAPSMQHLPAPSVASASSDARSDTIRGGDSLGSGNVTVALATYFPWPRPDLAELPHGSRGDVVVEVVIDANGRIVESRLAQGLGPTIDANVLTTIQAWTFKPATKDGMAIASEQELLFHYERA